MKQVYVDLVRVAVGVAVVGVAVDDVGHGGLAAAVDRGAVGDLELDGRVVDAEVVAELVVQAFQDGFAFSERHLDDLHVAGERVGLRGEAPDVEVVDVEDAVDSLHGRADVAEVDGARGAFEQDVQRLADDDQELQRIIAAMSSESTGSIHSRPVRRMARPPTMTAAVEMVSPSMCRKTLRMLTSPENFQSRAAMAAVHQDAGGGDDHHQSRLDGDRRDEAMDRGDGDPGGERR